MRPLLSLLAVLLLSGNALAQCASGTGSCNLGSDLGPNSPIPGPLPEPQRTAGYIGENPTPAELQAAGFVRLTRPDGSAYWAQTKPGVAADARGRTYAVPVRAAAKAAAGWVAAPRLRPVGPQETACDSCDAGASEPPPPDDLPSEPQTVMGPIGPQGPAGPAGPKGDPGEVDYDRLQGMIASVIGQSLQQMQPQIESAIVERMAADPRFRGPPADVNELSPEQLDQLAEAIAQRLPPITFTANGDTETVYLGGKLNIRLTPTSGTSSGSN